MTDVERSQRPPTPKSRWGAVGLRRASGPLVSLVALGAIAVPLAAPAGADQLSDARARAAQIEAEIQQTGAQISALGQQYDAAQIKVQSFDQQIGATEEKITADKRHVVSDRTTLRKAAVNAFVSDGLAASENPLFANNQKTLGAQQEYNQVAEGDLGTAVANLHAAEGQLAQQQASLQSQKQHAAAAATAAASAEQQAQQAQSQQNSALSQVKGQIQTLIAQQEAAAAAAARAAAAAKIAAAQQAAAAQAAQAAAAGRQQAASVAPSPSSTGSPGTTTATRSVSPAPTSASPSTSAFSAPVATTATTTPPAAPVPVAPAPPSSSGGEGAVQAAETQIGVPYVWGGETPGVGFDCSGLVAWAWGQVGVSLPHYSGAQMADSTPVPISDLQPGDLLFYGPGGADHVAMYVGGGTMIEAPYTGATVHLTGLRLGAGFAGAGRP